MLCMCVLCEFWNNRYVSFWIALDSNVITTSAFKALLYVLFLCAISCPGYSGENKDYEASAEISDLSVTVITR